MRCVRSVLPSVCGAGYESSVALGFANEGEQNGKEKKHIGFSKNEEGR